MEFASESLCNGTSASASESENENGVRLGVRNEVVVGCWLLGGSRK